MGGWTFQMNLDVRMDELPKIPDANPLRPVEGIKRKERVIKGVDDVKPIIPLITFTEDELEEAKKILVLKLEVGDLLKGNYSPKQLAEWSKTRGLWALIGAGAGILTKGCL